MMDYDQFLWIMMAFHWFSLFFIKSEDSLLYTQPMEASDPPPSPPRKKKKKNEKWPCGGGCHFLVSFFLFWGGGGSEASGGRRHSHSATQPGQPASQPASLPVSQPASQPASPGGYSGWISLDYNGISRIFIDYNRNARNSSIDFHRL